MRINMNSSCNVLTGEQTKSIYTKGNHAVSNGVQNTHVSVLTRT